MTNNKNKRRKKRLRKSANTINITMTLLVSGGFLIFFLLFWWALSPHSGYESIALKSADWMLHRQEQNGHFGYEYDPWRDEESNEDNIIRQAGAGYIMSEMFETYQDGKYLESTIKNLDYLADRSKYEERDGQERAYILELGESKTGAMALADISCQRVKKTSLENEKITRFCDGISNTLDFLTEENGGYSAKYYPKTPKTDGRYRLQSPYYNGEAFLADVIDYEKTPEENKKQNLKTNFQYFQKYYENQIDADKQGTDNTKDIIGFYLWGMRAINRLDEINMEDKYADFAYMYTNHVIQEKSLDNKIFQNEHSINNCYALEGVISAFAIADRHGEKILAQKYREVAEENLTRLADFQAKKNMQNSTIIGHSIKRYGFPDKEQSIGGFFNSLQPNQQQMRIDNTQHCLGAYLLAEKYL